MSFLSESIALVRKYTDDPAVNAKWTDTEIIDHLEAEWDTIQDEICRNSAAPLVVRHTLSMADGDTVKLLPPTIGQVLRLRKTDTTTGRTEWEISPRSRWNPAGPGVIFEANTLRFEPAWSSGTCSLELEYIPTGCTRLHTATTTTVTATTLQLGAATVGARDLRVNAYVGSVLRVLSTSVPANNLIQERVIQSQVVGSNTLCTVTVSPAFDPVPTGTVTYEIAPLLYRMASQIVPLAVARVILAVDAPARFSSITQLYNEKMRKLRLREGSVDQIVGTRFQMDTSHNQRTLVW